MEQNKTYNWLIEDKDINGMTDETIIKLKKNYSMMEDLLNDQQKYISEYNKFIENVYIKLNVSKMIHIIPPYTVDCHYKNIDGCPKKSAFLKNSKYYCWFHVLKNE